MKRWAIFTLSLWDGGIEFPKGIRVKPVLTCLNSLQFGGVRIVVQNGRVVQIEQTGKYPFNQPDADRAVVAGEPEAKDKNHHDSPDHERGIGLNRDLNCNVSRPCDCVKANFEVGEFCLAPARRAQLVLTRGQFSD